MSFDKSYFALDEGRGEHEARSVHHSCKFPSPHNRFNEYTRNSAKFVKKLGSGKILVGSKAVSVDDFHKMRVESDVANDSFVKNQTGDLSGIFPQAFLLQEDGVDEFERQPDALSSTQRSL